MSKKSSVKRWSAKRKQAVVLRLLRGESLDALSRETGQPAAVLSQWRDEFLGGYRGAETALAYVFPGRFGPQSGGGRTACQSRPAL